MKVFRTIVNIEESNRKIDYNSGSLFLGSCFAEVIGSRMNALKFPAVVNPFGVLYNPISVSNSIEFLMKSRSFQQDNLIFHNGLYVSLYHDTGFAGEKKHQRFLHIKKSIDRASGSLKNSQFLFITLGTAWVYEYKKTGQVVSNCHKLPACEFNRYKIGVSDILKIYKCLIHKLLVFNPDLKIIFTVSPIRHWKDGAEENQISKATLILAVHKLREMYSHISYFPAYEIMMDELRDYRFYAEDMLHLSLSAQNYIWERFSESYIGTRARKIMDELNEIHSAMQHKPFFPQSVEHQKFKESMLLKVIQFGKKYPFLDVKNEKKFFHGNK